MAIFTHLHNYVHDYHKILIQFVFSNNVNLLINVILSRLHNNVEITQECEVIILSL